MYNLDMFTEEQKVILGWVLTVCMSIGIIGLNFLIAYSFYCGYRVIKNFSKKY